MVNERMRFLQATKNEFLLNEAIPVLMLWMEDPLTQSPTERDAETNDVIELWLCLFRNLLAIPNPDKNEASRCIALDKFLYYIHVM